MDSVPALVFVLLKFLRFHGHEQYKLLSHTAVSGTVWMLLGSPDLQILAPQAQGLDLREAGSPREQRFICMTILLICYLCT